MLDEKQKKLFMQVQGKDVFESVEKLGGEVRLERIPLRGKCKLVTPVDMSKRFTILLSPEVPENCQQYYIAEELGRLILFSDFAKSEKGVVDKIQYRQTLEEYQANEYFAREVLLPADAFVEKLKDCYLPDEGLIDFSGLAVEKKLPVSVLMERARDLGIV